MVSPFLFLLATAVAASANSLSEDKLFFSLLKRQEPGTPAYNCHSNCGNAISLARAGGDICNNEAFVDSYENCLQCSGPDNFNIWRYYGRTLSAAGEECGFETEPLSGKQPDVSPPAGGASSTPASEPSATPIPSSDASASASPTSLPAESPVPTSEVFPETTRYEAPDSAITSVQSPSPSAEVSTYISASNSSVPTPSSNGTASFTSSPPAQFTGNAASNLQVPGIAGAIGAAVVGALSAIWAFGAEVAYIE